MSLVERRLEAVYKKADIIYFDSKSKFILMSDCHRGQGNTSDNFMANQNLFFGAMNHYYKNGFTYIELGDGDELWENRKIESIIEAHSDAFWIMSKFHHEDRFYMIYGNHDAVKHRKNYAKKHCCEYYMNSTEKTTSLFDDLDIHEGLILENPEIDARIFLAHGHQGDLLNDIFWPVARFLVRYVWRPLELIGFVNPSNAVKNNGKSEKHDDKYNRYADMKEELMVLGHTHRPVYPKPGEGMYFNDGSCVHPRCITGIEIENNQICLIKWCVQTRENGDLFVGREILEGPYDISKYYVSI